MTENENINALRDLAEQANGMIHWEINSDEARKIYETVISTLDLINRQKAEIERLQRLGASAARKAVDERKKLLDAKLEIGRMKNNVFCNVVIDEENMKNIVAEKMQEFELDIKSIKAEALKEFAERLKEEEFASGVFGASYCREKIDILVKEMVGEGK